MKNLCSFSVAIMAFVVAIALSTISSTPALATADSLVRNTSGFFAKNASDGKYYPAQLCFSTDGSQSLIPCGKVSGGVGMAPTRLNTSSTNLPLNTYVTFVSSVPAAATWVSVYNGTSSELTLATGTSGNPTDKVIVPPSITRDYPLYLPAGSALSLVAKSATASSGIVGISFIQ
jgi:hypothetical protein